MSCMKCGRDIEEGHVFCAGCLEVMAKYPVKPGIAVQLPGRKDSSPAKKVAVKRRQPPTAEEQMRRLRKKIRNLIILWLVTLALLAGTIYPTVKYFSGKSFLLPGQNYTTITGTDTAGP